MVSEAPTEPVPAVAFDEPAAAVDEPAAAAAEPVAAFDEPVAAEPVAAPEPVVAPEPVAAPEPVTAPEPVSATEPIVEEPVAEEAEEASPIIEPAPVDEPVALDQAAALDEIVPAAVHEPDDLTKIPGIGPKVAMALAAAGITTYAKLAETDAIELKQAIAAAGMRGSASLVTWPAKARDLAGTVG